MFEFVYVLIVCVVDDSPADIAGLKEQDVILKVDDEIAENPSKLRLLISSKHPGDRAKLLIFREGREKKITVTLTSRPGEENLSKRKNDLNKNTFDILGLIVSETGGELKIKKIDPESNAYKRGLREGDIFNKINTKSVTTLKDYNNAIKNIKSGDVIMIRKLMQDGGSQYIAFEVN